MKRYLHAFAMCQSMFCALPCPWNIWDEDARDKMLLFLPAVGLEIGAIWAFLAWLASRLSLPAAVTGILLSACPFVLTGYIHLDGYMDVTDAVKSCRSLDRRREILKDSHVGSFAVIGCILLLLAQFALFTAGNNSEPWILILIPAVSRLCSVLAISLLRPMSTSQYAGQTASKKRITLLFIVMILFLLAGFFFCGRYGLALIGCLAGYGMSLRRGYRSLEGMNGDISGYALTIGELCGVAVWVLI